MKKFLIPALCAAAALTFTGCINDFNEDDFVSTVPAIMENIKVDGNFADDLRIIQTSKMKTEQGVEVVCVRARLKRESFKNFVKGCPNTVNLSYKYTWFDAQGKEVSGSKWQKLSLKPGSEFACTSSAPAKGITKVTLTIRKDCSASACKAPAKCSKAPATKCPKTVRNNVKQAPKAAKNVKNDCLCGCANGEKCYCPAGAPCPNAAENKKK